MPELPEVETIRQDLRRKILKKNIIEVEILYTKSVAGKGKELQKKLIGTSIEEIDRIGKLMIFRFGRNEHSMLIHLKMTGQLVYRIGKKIFAGGHSMSTLQTALPDKHTQVILTFADDSKLYFNDQRRFGYIKIVDAPEVEAIIAAYGIEPLTPGFTHEAFQKLIGNKKTILKAFLLNQKFIAGIGNIYADEIAHSARLMPTRRLHSLSTKDIQRLYDGIQKVLAQAIALRGTTFNNYVDSDGQHGNFTAYLKVYEHEGDLCDQCLKSTIKKTRVAGRGTYFCPTCQL